MVITLALCLAVGLSLGLLGAGGSVLTVPIFVYSGGMNPQEAISLSLLVVSVTSFVGSIRYMAKQWVNFRLVIIFIIFGSAAALAGSRLSFLVSGRVLLFLFGAIMLVTGMILFFKDNGSKDGGAQCRPRFIPAMLVSSILGILTGFLGVGGGFLIVPALSLMMKCSMRSAIGTSLVIISANAMAGFLGHIMTQPFDLKLAAGYTAATVLGAVLGSLFTEKISSGFLKKGFALLIMGTGIFILVQNGH